MRRGILLAAAVVMCGRAAAARADAVGVAVDVDGGVGGYTGALGQALQPGAAWGIRAAKRVGSFLSVGAQYQGAANRLAGTDPLAATVLARNGGALLVRVSPQATALEPYLELGAGAAFTAPSDGQAAGPDFKSAASFTAPVALGLDWHASVLRAGARVSYGLVGESNAYRGGGGNQLSATLSVGAQF